jgi:hypothetical protein
MPVCVAGMHRSGTSMVAKYLHRCGLDLGADESLMGPAAENPEGFWEHVDIVETNEEILNQLGGGWDCPPPEPSDWTAGTLAPLAVRARAILDGFAGRDPWGWKDPRTSLTFPFWAALQDGLRVVVVVRNPLEVALSLRQRNGFSYALGLTLWEITNRRLLAATDPADRVVTHYDAYFDDPRPEVRRLLAALAMPTPDDTLSAIGPASSGLRHHRLTTQDLLDAGVSAPVLDLYRSLCEEAVWDGPGLPTGAVPAPAATPTALELGVGRVSRSVMEVRRLERELNEHRRSLANREERVADLELSIRAYQTSQRALEQELERAREETAERERIEREAAALRQTAADQADHLAVLGIQLATLADHETELRSLLASAHEQLLHRDAEIVATLGSALHPHAPGAPAAIYYRQLLEKIRAMVDANVPPTAPILVVSGGDDAMLAFGGRPARHFPLPETDGASRYLPTDDATAQTQLDLLREQGAAFLVLPASGRAWLARHPDLARHLDERYPVVVRDEAIAVVYALNGSTGAVP